MTDALLAPEVVDALAPLVDRFEAEGHRLFLVGGAVRDLLLGRDADVDYDLTTDAPPDTTKRLLDGWADDLWTQGERFGTIGARREGRTVEITTHREEAYDERSRKPAVRYSTRVEADLSRRDFTVNAMALPLLGGELVDPFGGREDLLVHRRLRTPSSPEVAFDDDPLRILRAARFVARFDLDPVPALVAAASELVGRMAIVSAERVNDELSRLLAVPDPRPGVALLDRIGVLEVVVPEVAGSDRWGRVAAAPPDDVEGRLAVLMAPLTTRRIRDRLRALRRSRRSVDEVVALAAALGRVEAEPPPTWPAAEVRELVDELGGLVDRLPPLLATAAPDSADRLVARLAELRGVEDLDELSLPVGGDTVAGWLGSGPGPDVGAALRRLREARIEEGPLTVERARQLVEEGR